MHITKRAKARKHCTLAAAESAAATLAHSRRTQTSEQGAASSSLQPQSNQHSCMWRGTRSSLLHSRHSVQRKSAPERGPAVVPPQPLPNDSYHPLLLLTAASAKAVDLGLSVEGLGNPVLPQHQAVCRTNQRQSAATAAAAALGYCCCPHRAASRHHPPRPPQCVCVCVCLPHSTCTLSVVSAAVCLTA